MPHPTLEALIDSHDSHTRESALQSLLAHLTECELKSEEPWPEDMYPECSAILAKTLKSSTLMSESETTKLALKCVSAASVCAPDDAIIEASKVLTPAVIRVLEDGNNTGLAFSCVQDFATLDAVDLSDVKYRKLPKLIARFLRTDVEASDALQLLSDHAGNAERLAGNGELNREAFRAMGGGRIGAISGYAWNLCAFQAGREAIVNAGGHVSIVDCLSSAEFDEGSVEGVKLMLGTLAGMAGAGMGEVILKDAPEALMAIARARSAVAHATMQGEEAKDDAGLAIRYADEVVEGIAGGVAGMGEVGEAVGEDILGEAAGDLARVLREEEERREEENRVEEEKRIDEEQNRTAKLEADRIALEAEEEERRRKKDERQRLNRLEQERKELEEMKAEARRQESAKRRAEKMAAPAPSEIKSPSVHQEEEKKSTPRHKADPEELIDLPLSPTAAPPAPVTSPGIATLRQLRDDPSTMHKPLSTTIPSKPLSKFTPHDVASLLLSLGLRRYIKPVVIEREIDGATLVEATDWWEIKECGIAVTLHARRLLSWIYEKRVKDEGRSGVPRKALSTLNATEVEGMLASLNLDRYSGAFTANQIDGETLIHVKRREDLKVLGVIPVHGKKLLTKLREWRVVGVPISVLQGRTARGYREGEVVEANFRGRGRFYRGVVRDPNDEHRFATIMYDDGGTEYGVVYENIRTAK